MSWRWPMAGAVVAALLLAYIVGFERTAATTKHLEGRAGMLFERFEHDVLKSISISRPDAEQVQTVYLKRGERLENAAEGWLIEGDAERPADTAALQDVIGIWEYAEPLRVVGAATDDELREFGLMPPRSTIVFEFDTHRLVVELGAKGPTGNVYGRLDGGDVVVLRSVMDESLVTDAAKFVTQQGSGVTEIDRLILDAGLELPDDE